MGSAGTNSTPTTPTAKRARAPKSAATAPKTPVSASKERTRRASAKPKNYAQSDDDDEEEEVHDEFVEAKEDVDEESPSKKVKKEVSQDGEEIDGV